MRRRFISARLAVQAPRACSRALASRCRVGAGGSVAAPCRRRAAPGTPSGVAGGRGARLGGQRRSARRSVLSRTAARPGRQGILSVRVSSSAKTASPPASRVGSCAECMRDSSRAAGKACRYAAAASGLVPTTMRRIRRQGTHRCSGIGRGQATSREDSRIGPAPGHPRHSRDSRELVSTVRRPCTKPSRHGTQRLRAASHPGIHAPARVSNQGPASGFEAGEIVRLAVALAKASRATTFPA